MEVTLLNKETKDIRVIVMMTYDMLTRIDDYRFTNRIASRGEAVRLLVEEGLQAKKEKEK